MRVPCEHSRTCWTINLDRYTKYPTGQTLVCLYKVKTDSAYEYMTEHGMQVQSVLSSRGTNLSASNVRHFPVQLATAQVSSLSTDLVLSSTVSSSQPLDGTQTAQETHTSTAPVYDAAQEQALSAPGQASPSGQDVHEDDFEEGELADAAIPESSTTDGLDQGQQQQAVGGGAETHPAIIGKRGRGERAGKRVRQRQAKRAREEEAQQRFQHGLQQTAYAPKVVPISKTVRPVCK